MNDEKRECECVRGQETEKYLHVGVRALEVTHDSCDERTERSRREERMRERMQSDRWSSTMVRRLTQWRH